MTVKNSSTIELLEEIQGWMSENDYECGPHGSQLFEQITQELEKLKNEA